MNKAFYTVAVAAILLVRAAYARGDAERELVTGVLVSVDISGKTIKVRSVTASRILGPGKPIQQMTVGHMSSLGNGTITSSRTIRQNGHVYTIDLAGDLKVRTAAGAAKPGDLKAGMRVQVLGTVADTPGHARIDSYKVVDGQLVLNTVESEKTATATTINILPAQPTK